MRVEVLCPATDLTVASETIEHLRSMDYLPFGASISVDEEERGFTWNANKLLRGVMETNATHVVIINEDIRVRYGRWLTSLIYNIDQSPYYGMASPTGACRTQPICFGGTDEPFQVMRVSQLPMFCTVIKREVIDALGLLESEYIHYGSDSDYCERAILAGWQLIWVQYVYIENKLSPIREEWKEHDRRVFFKRWGW